MANVDAVIGNIFPEFYGGKKRIFTYADKTYAMFCEFQISQVVYVYEYDETLTTWSEIASHDFTAELSAPSNLIWDLSTIMDSTGLLHVVYSEVDFSTYPVAIYYRTYDIATDTWGTREDVVIGYMPDQDDNFYTVDINVDSSDEPFILSIFQHTGSGYMDVWFHFKSMGLWVYESTTALGQAYPTMFCHQLEFDSSDVPFFFSYTNGIGEDFYKYYKSGGVWLTEPVEGITASYLFYSHGFAIYSDDIYLAYVRVEIASQDTSIYMKKYMNGVGWGAAELVLTIPYSSGYTCMLPYIATNTDGDITILYSIVPVDAFADPYAFYYVQKIDGSWGTGQEIVTGVVGDFYGAGAVANYDKNQSFDGFMFAYFIASGGTYGYHGYAMDFVLAPTPGDTPVITSITPDHFGVNKRITIAGDDFGDNTAGKSGVVFVQGDEKEADIVSWSNNSVVCYVPEMDSGPCGIKIKRLDS